MDVIFSNTNACFSYKPLKKYVRSNGDRVRMTLVTQIIDGERVEYIRNTVLHAAPARHRYSFEYYPIHQVPFAD